MSIHFVHFANRVDKSSSCSIVVVFMYILFVEIKPLPLHCNIAHKLMQSICALQHIRTRNASRAARANPQICKSLSRQHSRQYNYKRVCVRTGFCVHRNSSIGKVWQRAVSCIRDKALICTACYAVTKHTHAHEKSNTHTILIKQLTATKTGVLNNKQPLLMLMLPRWTCSVC